MALIGPRQQAATSAFFDVTKFRELLQPPERAGFGSFLRCARTGSATMLGRARATNCHESDGKGRQGWTIRGSRLGATA
jgi:hypothetical protein